MTKKIILVCSDCLSRNYHYNKSKDFDKRLVLKKFCPKCNASTIHKESR